MGQFKLWLGAAGTAKHDGIKPVWKFAAASAASFRKRASCACIYELPGSPRQLMLLPPASSSVPISGSFRQYSPRERLASDRKYSGDYVIEKVCKGGADVGVYYKDGGKD